jgi:hypothetical protein
MLKRVLIFSTLVLFAAQVAVASDVTTIPPEPAGLPRSLRRLWIRQIRASRMTCCNRRSVLPSFLGM